MRICDYRDKDIEDTLDEIRKQLIMLTHQDPDKFVITLNYDGYTLLLETESNRRTIIVR